ncbi:MAG: sodium:solute symporter family protein [Clostridia bacterium]|jgi:SSS family solute:Na+ symporter|nr:sodium:solute symporter family protein [Clostridia bacterium]
MNIGIIILGLYTLSLLGIAFYASKQDKKNIKDFATASSSLGVFVLTLTFSATYHSSYAFLGAPGFVYKNGVGWWVNGIWTVFPGVLFWIIGRRFWLLGKTQGYISMAQYIGDVYQNKFIGLVVTIIALMFTVPYVAMQAIGSGYIFQVISGGQLNYAFGTIVFFAIMIILVWLGGMKGVAITDAAQGVFMWIGMVIGSYIIINKNFGSVNVAYEAVFNQFPKLLTLPGPAGVVTPQDWISRWVIITIGMMMFPHVTLRFFSGKSLRVLKWSSVFSAIYLTSIYVFTPAIGMIGNILMPNIASPDTVFPEMLLKYTPIVFAALIISGALAASMSTGDSQLHAVSSMISTDVYKTYIKKDASDYEQYKVAKIATLIFGLLSVVVALMKPGMISSILALANGGVAALAPAMIGGVYWKKSTPQAALSSILIGEATMLITTFVVKSPLGFMGGFWGLVVALIVFVIVSLVTKPVGKTIEIIDLINNFFHAEEA